MEPVKQFSQRRVGRDTSAGYTPALRKRCACTRSLLGTRTRLLTVGNEAKLGLDGNPYLLIGAVLDRKCRSGGQQGREQPGLTGPDRYMIVACFAPLVNYKAALESIPLNYYLSSIVSQLLETHLLYLE